MMSRFSRSSLWPTLFVFALLIGVGTAAYSYFERWSWLEALYATIITMTTVGYGDLSPSSSGGRIFAIFFTLGAIGLAGYAISNLAATVFDREEARRRRRRQGQRMKRIERLDNHVIIAGGGGIGRVSAYLFQRAGQPIVLVDKDEARLRLALLHLDESYIERKYGRYHDVTRAVNITEEEQQSLEDIAGQVDVPYLLADPTDDSTLLAAGIAQALGLVTVLDSDESNLFVVVSARALANELDNPSLRIFALVNDDNNGNKLKLAGADFLIMPEKMSGLQVQRSMMEPKLAEFLRQLAVGGGDYNVELVSLTERPQWTGQTVAQLLEQQVNVLVLLRDGQKQHAPPAGTQLRAGDAIICFAPRKDEG